MKLHHWAEAGRGIRAGTTRRVRAGALGVLLAIGLAPAGLQVWACVGADGSLPPWGGSGANGIAAAKIQRAWSEARSKGTSVPPSPPVFGIHPTVFILIENAAAGAPFPYPNATLWSQRLLAISTYYGEVSHGQFRLEPALESFGVANDGVIGPVTVSSLNSGVDVGVGESQRFAAAAIRAANPYINFAAYDKNSDGVIEPDELHIVIVQAGDETSYGNSRTPRAWAHMQWETPQLTGVTAATDSDGVNLTSYCYLGSAFAHSSMAEMGPMTHELGHDLGLPDLYDVDGSGSGGAWEGLGVHCLMASGAWGSAGGKQGSVPVHLDGFFKSWLGWANVTTLTTPGNSQISLNAANGSNDVLRINVPNSAEFFIVENRQHTGYDTGLPGTRGGLAIYHCDGDLLTDTTVRLNNEVNTNPSDPGIWLVEADGDNALFSRANAGADTDYFRSGTSVALTSISTPNSRLRSGASSGLTLTGIGASQAVMSFVVGALTEDIDHSGIVDAVDIQLVINAALGLGIGGRNADVNGDLTVDAVDVQRVINAGLGKG